MEAPFPRAQGAIVVARPELGIKRICGSCGAKFYDLARESIVCPKCGTIYEAAATTPTRTPAAVARPEPVPAPVAAVEEPELPQPAEAEVISLEDVDAEEKSKAKTAVPDAEAEPDEVEIATKETDDTFLEQEEEEPGDVSDIIGEKVEEDDET